MGQMRSQTSLMDGVMHKFQVITEDGNLNDMTAIADPLGSMLTHLCSICLPC